MYHKDIGSCEMYRHKTNARVQIPEGEKFMNERNVRPFSKRDSQFTSAMIARKSIVLNFVITINCKL